MTFQIVMTVAMTFENVMTIAMATGSAILSYLYDSHHSTGSSKQILGREVTAFVVFFQHVNQNVTPASSAGGSIQGALTIRLHSHRGPW